jgi:hypothetical protein
MTATPSRAGRQAMAVIWPAFLMASVLEMLVFGFVDPHGLLVFGGRPLDWPPLAVYSLAFFVFWAFIAAAGAITQVLQRDEDVSTPRH